MDFSQHGVLETCLKFSWCWLWFYTLDGVTILDMKFAHLKFSTVFCFLTMFEALTNFTFRNAGSHNQWKEIMHFLSLLGYKTQLNILNVQISYISSSQIVWKAVAHWLKGLFKIQPDKHLLVSCISEKWRAIEQILPLFSRQIFFILQQKHEQNLWYSNLS